MSKRFKEGEVFSTVAGTPYYYVTEMLRKQAYDERADIWCLGIILFQLYFGQLPWKVPMGEEELLYMESAEGKALVKEVQEMEDKPGISMKAVTRMYRGVIGSYPHKGGKEEFYHLLEHLVCPQENRLTAVQAAHHPFFSAIDGLALDARTLKSPFTPVRNHFMPA